ncbi:putative receptor protein kinase ZmPK1 [Juglans regia]|uniref:Receptor-like serine/threonine-protein kinase n=2 Tax=Juglans regia TaxID=51240 RepID=A0A6P9EYZ0_JUGRE|nr:putative receptor protein kinase ZmPK1 [Juglans regia]
MDISTFFLLFLLQTPLSSSKALDILKGSSLSVGKPNSEKLVSASGEFSAGFFPVGDNAFCFSIWLTISSVPTVVWMANRDDPVERGSAISISKDGKLILRNSFRTIIWTTKTAALTTSQTSQLQLQLLNTGNLVLQDNSDNGVIWQSFDSPTDTLLPRQTLTGVSSLVSKSRQGDYSSGYYTLSFDNDNVLRLLFQDPTISSLYWPDPSFTDPAEADRSRYNNSRAAVLDSSGYFWSSDHFKFRATDFPLVLHRRLTLDTDGNLRSYSLQKMNETWDWVVTWQAFSDPCRIHGICGPNSLCSYNHASGRSCSCLRGFKIKDPTDWSYGCVPEFNLSCNQSDESSFVQLAHVEFYGSDSDFLPNVTLQSCKKECLRRCNCNGFQFRFSTDEDGAGVYNCYPKFLLANGRRSPGFEGDLYLRLPKAGLVYNKTPDKVQRLECLHKPVTQPKKTYENKTVKLLLWVAIIMGGVEVTCIFLVFVFLSRTSKNPDPAAQAYLLTTRFKRFTFSELKRATQGFRELIGQGAGGAVYKGVLPDQRVAAIKRLNDATQGEAEFLAEVNTVGRLNHMNLIEIWGYCAEGKHRLLVYEYMELGSLAENLSSNTLDWEKRFEIAVGTAKGLAYLHEECLEWVLHCDVKPQNILLDSNYQPKIADFGLSKLRNRGEVDRSRFSKMRGTRGYMAPEWVYNLPISSKVDVYSYGVVVLEMVTGKSPSEMHTSSESRGAREYKRLVTLVREEIMNKKAASRGSLIEEIEEPSMAGKYDMAMMELLVQMALQCVAEDKDDRPTMKQVVEMLLSHKVD